MSSTPPTIVYLGASRGIGFATYHRLSQLRPEIRSILLLRNPDHFHTEEYASVSEEIKSRTVIYKGDAHIQENVEEVLRMAGPNLEAVVFTIGAPPPKTTGEMFKALKSGFPIPDICTRALANTIVPFCSVYAQQPESKKPRFILTSSMGMGAEAHKCLPFALKLFYTALLTKPHEDKIGMEVLFHEALVPSSDYPSFIPSPSEIPEKVLSPSALAALPKSVIQPSDALVLRPALLTDGPEKGLSKLRVGQEGEIKGCYSVSRLDVGAFTAACLADKDGELSKKWFGKQIVLAY